MSKHLATAQSKHFLLRGRNLQQNHAQSGQPYAAMGQDEGKEMGERGEGGQKETRNSLIYSYISYSYSSWQYTITLIIVIHIYNNYNSFNYKNHVWSSSGGSGFCCSGVRDTCSMRREREREREREEKHKLCEREEIQKRCCAMSDKDSWREIGREGEKLSASWEFPKRSEPKTVWLRLWLQFCQIARASPVNSPLQITPKICVAT